VVSVPNRKILFAGDVLFTDFHPFLADGDIAGWARTLDDLRAMADWMIAYNVKSRYLGSK
jgi:glyoxylase-like metal-dependent hydrolase (beta-lactamase superfamily II)